MVGVVGGWRRTLDEGKKKKEKKAWEVGKETAERVAQCVGYPPLPLSEFGGSV